jgi:hypothetical protein
MKIKLFAAGLLMLGAASAASAQSVPDDIRCFVLSNIFSKAAKDEKARSVATQGVLFYLGRLDGRADTKTLTDGLRAKIAGKDAGPQMTACAQRIGHAEQNIQQIGKSIAPLPGQAKKN